jgi:hypothetical protein
LLFDRCFKWAFAKTEVQAWISIPRHAGIDFGSPAFDPAGQGTSVLYTLGAQPDRHVETAHPAMAIAHELVAGIERLQTGRDAAHGYQAGPLYAADLVFPWLPDVHEEHRIVLGERLEQLRRRDF